MKNNTAKTIRANLARRLPSERADRLGAIGVADYVKRGILGEEYLTPELIARVVRERLTPLGAEGTLGRPLTYSEFVCSALDNFYRGLSQGR